MSDSFLSIPVALLVFNRPDTTARVFEAVRRARPQQLLLIADGPRADCPGDVLKCAEVLGIVENVDWTCEVLRNCSETNLGCKVRVSSGLDWVFGLVEHAIILEDDCLPDQTFFRFCEEMLNRYRDDERVMSICGSNLLGSWKSDIQSYHFSFYGGIWGWATWRRAWAHYDVSMALWRELPARRQIREVLGGGALYRSRALDFDRFAAGQVDTWDYQWTFAQLMRSGLTLISSTNLVSNIGFNSDATHTLNPESIFADLPRIPCVFPLKAIEKSSVDLEFDHEMLAKVLSGRSPLSRLSDLFHSLTGGFCLYLLLLLRSFCRNRSS